MKTIYKVFSFLILSLLLSSCIGDWDVNNDEKGYLKLDINTLVSTNNRGTSAPKDYNAKTLAVKIIDERGTTVMETKDVDKDTSFKGNIVLSPGTYTITASSAGWDGSDSGFGVPYYVGSTKATVKAKTLTEANLTLTQANVKVTVKYDDNFRAYFTSANCIVTSAIENVSLQRFSLTTVGSAYFPVADLNFFLAVRNKGGEEFSKSWDVTDVKPRDHFIINYKIAEAGSLGGVTVKVDDATNAYNFTIEIPRKSSTSLLANAANAFTNMAYISGAVTAKTAQFDESNLALQYRKKADADWTNVAASALTKGDNDNYSYTLTNLAPATDYVYRLRYNDGDTNVNSNEISFTTEKVISIQNSSFENWYKDGSAWVPGTQGQIYWNTSNPGSTSMGDSYNVTTSSTDLVHSGTYSAKLANKFVVIKLAAASLFTGTFDGLISTSGAKLTWGVPFTSRPSALKGYMSYTPGAINRVGKNLPSTAPAKGETDACQIFCALLTEQLKVGGNAAEGVYQKSTEINWDTDPRIIAYGELTQSSSDGGKWKEFNIPLKYHDIKAKPNYMLIVISASKWGDYFHGCDSNVLYLDDFEFEYGTPIVK